MTDKPEPTAEHIDAVALAHFRGNRSDLTLPEWHEVRMTGKRILTSTDPAVHAAQAANLPTDVMLDALVRAGVLTEDEWGVKCLCGKTLRGSPDEVAAWTREHDDSPKASHIVVWSPPSVKPWTRRLVTRWEPTP